MQAVLEQKEYTKIPTPKILLWIAIGSMIMLFAGLTSAYIVRQAEGNWIVFTLPKLFTVSTIIILLSSIPMQYAVYSVRNNQLQNLKASLIATLGLGIAFMFFQFLGWTQLVEQGIYLAGATANPSGSFLYVLSGLHLAHLAGGIIYLIIINTKALMGKYNSENYLGIQLCSTYWHFLDLLWVYLFIFLNIVR